jgi:dTDP-N-acetylfucosamine:lipid II N-acetylfucosaminyltransferase
MYLHLAYDSPFADHLIRYCNQQSDQNKFIVFAKKLKYVKSDVTWVKDYEAFQALNIRADDFKRIFIHYLGVDSVKFILQYPAYGEYYWAFWGSDGYRIPELQAELYLPRTHSIAQQEKPLRWRLAAVLNRWKGIFVHSDAYKALQSIKTCCTWVSGDYELIRKLAPSIQLQFFSYLSAAELFGQTLVPATTTSTKPDAVTVLLGNSLNMTNNHLDALQYVSRAGFPVKQIILPISYNGTEPYKKVVRQAARDMFGDRAMTLEQFMSLPEYLNLISTCDVVVFFHMRQQGANNALSLLWMGKLLIMHSSSTLYQTLAGWGLSVLPSDSIGNYADLLRAYDSFADRAERNRSILSGIFSEESVTKAYADLFKLDASDTSQLS